MGIVDLIGYSASAVLIISFLLADIRKLRIVNTVGCALFVIYGFMLGNNWAIIVTNVFIIGVNLYHLLKSAPVSTEN